MPKSIVINKQSIVSTKKHAELIQAANPDQSAPVVRAAMLHVLFAHLNKTQRAECVAHLFVSGAGGKKSPLVKAILDAAKAQASAE